MKEQNSQQINAMNAGKKLNVRSNNEGELFQFIKKKK
jgi:hypothetical protein